jgi:carboxypeptidase D
MHIWLLVFLPILVTPVPLEVPAGDAAFIHQLYTRGITVESAHGDWWTVHVPAEMVATLKRLTAVREPAKCHAARSAPHLTSYRALVDFCTRMQAAHPDVATKFSIGRSVEGRELVGVRIRTAPRRKKIKLVGNMHGDEVVGREILIRLIEHLLTARPAVLGSAEIHILPSMNPDGFHRLRRTNARGYDLNRNFPDRFYGQITPLQPETRAVMAWSRRENFTLSANFHGGDLVVNYPYDGNAQRRSGIAAPTKDDMLFRRLARTYADAHPDMRRSARFPGGITNGARWYVLYGGMQDWNYLHASDYEVTVEVSHEKIPPAGEMPGYWEKNRNSMLAFLEFDISDK